MEIIDKRDKGLIEVWMTNSEQEQYDRSELTQLLLAGTDAKKCRVIFFLSGKGDLFSDTEKLLLNNIGCA